MTSRNTDKQNTSFLGVGWGFPPEFPRGLNGVVMKEGEEDIRQSLGIILTTSVGERLMRPDFGCNLKDYLFEPLDEGLQAYLAELIKTAVLYHEPRVILDQVLLSANPREGALTIELQYTIRATNTRTNYVFPFYKDEGSDIADRTL